MTKIIIESVYAVGMHHYGGRSLEVGSGYKVIPEPNNKYDTSALAVCDVKTNSVKAYIQRSDAKVISTLIKEFCIQRPILLKPKFEPIFRRGGPVQRCNIGFFYNGVDADKLVRLSRC